MFAPFFPLFPIPVFLPQTDTFAQRHVFLRQEQTMTEAQWRREMDKRGNGATKKTTTKKNSAEIETKQRSETTKVQCVDAAELS